MTAEVIPAEPPTDPTPRQLCALEIVPAVEYHADPRERPSLSQSMAHTLISRSPSHAWREHPRLGGLGRATTRAMDAGTIVHSLLLNGSETDDSIVLLDYENYRTKAAQTDRDIAILDGKTPILRMEYEGHRVAANAVLLQLAEFGIELNGQSEGVGYWSETADDGTEILCRCRMDHWSAPLILDFKTTSDAHPRKCERSIIDHGYDVQAYAYQSAIGKIFPDLAGRTTFLNIFIEMEPPYLVTPLKPDGSIMQLGRSKWRRAVNLWAKCLREDKWPGYATEIVSATAPQWAVTAEMDASPSSSFSEGQSWQTATDELSRTSPQSERKSPY